LCTFVGGKYLVSTVGEYLPSEGVREILAQSRGFNLTERGDAREAEWLRKNSGYDDIGCDRKYETMVFNVVKGEFCTCGCGIPKMIPSELDFKGYNKPKEATEGHMELCKKWSERMGEEV